MKNQQGNVMTMQAGALTLRDAFSAYYELTKPGITLMVVISTAAGFYLALPREFLTLEYAVLFLLTVVGTALVSAGSCVLNHVMEREYDREMKRTMFRPIPSGKIRWKSALIFGVAISTVGLALLMLAQPLTAGLALLTFVLYLAVYTPMKRRTQLSTLVGGIPGALPPLAGYATISGHIGPEAFALFMILFLWQMPHFLSLAWMYRKDYERGGFPMLTVLDGSGIVVARHIVSYSLMLLLFSLLPTLLSVTGVLYFIGAAILGGALVTTGIRFFYERSNSNARTVLLSSYFYLLALITLMFIDKA
ncbi:MAG: protoheme IX farnesyltransferase [Ignavibacteria bacterium]|nr:MAG: protoheme IX farnesyltransferase [Ignavibacteria bacterium]